MAGEVDDRTASCISPSPISIILYMERPPSGESSLDNRENRELSFDEQLTLATVLLQAVDKRNRFVEGYGGFDTFAEAWQHVGDNRAVYDELEKAAARARQELDEKITDKKAFVEQLRNAGHEDFANRIASMFGVSSKVKKESKGSIFSRFRKKR